MDNKKEKRLKRAKKFRVKNKFFNKETLCVFKSSKHIYAQIISGDRSHTITSASSLSAKIKNGSNIEAASEVGKLIAKLAKDKKIKQIAFDRSGFKYHGRIKALAESARKNGLKI